MAKKYYAVKTGRTPGIYETWAECQKQVSGFSGAVYKSFKTREEAVVFLNNSKSIESSPAETQVTAYVDGSYDSITNTFSYGMVLFHDGKEFHFSNRFADSDLAEMHNVAGEIKGAEAAILYCLKNHFASVTIFHDYEGIAKWCTWEWKTKKAGTIAYRNCYLKACSKLEIRFIKIKGHSGNKYNELADKLAKQALGILTRKGRDSIKVIFLDVDGVLAYEKYRNEETSGIDLEKVRLLKEICDNTDAKVVISSSWCGTPDYVPDCYYILVSILQVNGIRVLGNIPYLTSSNSDHRQSFTLADLEAIEEEEGVGTVARFRHG